MKFGWKVLIPIALAWLVLVMIGKAISTFYAPSGDSALGMIAEFVSEYRPFVIVVFVVLILIMLLVLMAPEKKKDSELAEEESGFVRPAEEFDAFAGGYPVPPLNGQALPPSPRAERAAAGVSAAQIETTSEEASHE